MKQKQFILSRVMHRVLTLVAVMLMTTVVNAITNPPVGSIGSAKATIGAEGVDVPCVQLWEDGPMWAKYNVGADLPQGYGDYHAWSEDVVTKQWGKLWSLPTKQDYDNLLTKCTVKWVTNYDGSYVDGLLCTGKGDYASNSVFFPAGGYKDGSSVESEGVSGNFWTSTADGETKKFYFGTKNSERGTYPTSSTNLGLSIRAVHVPSKVTFADAAITMDAFSTKEIKVNLKKADPIKQISMSVLLPKGMSIANYNKGSMAEGCNCFDVYKLTGMNVYQILIGGPNEIAGESGELFSLLVYADTLVDGKMYLKDINSMTTDLKGVAISKDSCTVKVVKNSSKVTVKGNYYKEQFAEKLSAATNDSITVIDLTSATFTDGPVTITPHNPNALIKAKEGQVANTNNVIVDGVCENFVLTDMYPFENEYPFVATNASYSRPAAKVNAMATICLPFDVEANNNVKFYQLEELNEEYMYMLAESVDEVEANKPAMFCFKQTNEPITASNVVVEPSDAFLVTNAGEYSLIGTYKTRELQAYSDDMRYYFAGTTGKFYNFSQSPKGYVVVPPFRAYFNGLHPTAKMVPSFSIVLDDDCVTAIKELKGNEVNANDGKYIENGNIVIIKTGKKFNSAGQRIK